MSKNCKGSFMIRRISGIKKNDKIKFRMEKKEKLIYGSS